MPTKKNTETSSDNTVEKRTSSLLLMSKVQNLETNNTFLDVQTTSTNSNEIQIDDNNNQSGMNNTETIDERNIAEGQYSSDNNSEINDCFTTTLLREDFPHKFQFFKDKAYPYVPKGVNNSDDQLNTMSYLIHLRGLVYNRNSNAGKEQKSHKLGYRFPLKELMANDELPQLKFLCNKFYKEKKERIPHLWLYYYPSTADVPHDHVKRFLKYNFPARSEERYIDAVHDHKNTECFCVAIHESVFTDSQHDRYDASNIIACICFRILKDNNDSGVFVYYLSTLQEKTFFQVSSARSFESMKCRIEGHGLGEMLLRNTQLFCKGIRDTYDIFLGVNKKMNIINYYKRLQFYQHKSWDDNMGQCKSELQECVLLEAESVDMYFIFSKDDEMIVPPLNAKNLLHRHCRDVPRPRIKLSPVPDENYKRLIKDLFDMRIAEGYKVDKHWDREAFHHMDREILSQVYTDGTPVDFGMFHDGSTYMSYGPCWEIYHKMWSETNMINFWDFAKYYNKLLKTNKVRGYRCQETIMPLEHFLMDYCSVGRVITDTECSKNVDFNLYCNFCKEPMTENPLSWPAVLTYNMRIVQAHFVGRGSHILSFIPKVKRKNSTPSLVQLITLSSLD